ncbi:MAG TPA: hypothetical protein DD628_00930 [Clostridiales bacterium]|nr:hypothetical protein [Candidatus Apopatosoma intestinale]
MFAGIGGFRTGLANAGDIFLPVGWCEIDRFAQKAYRTLYDTGGEYYCSDATKIDTDELPEIDLICGGFPCQPFSVSGRRLGFNDTRGTLFHEIVRVAQARHPKYLLLENVPGLLNHDGGKTFGTILETIHELGYPIGLWRVQCTTPTDTYLPRECSISSTSRHIPIISTKTISCSFPMKSRSFRPRTKDGTMDTTKRFPDF